MSIDVTTARTAIRAALQTIGEWSQAAEDLVLGTFIQESRLEYTQQLGGGPALGYCQMEPFTHDSLWANFLAYKEPLAAAIKALIAPAEPTAALLQTSVAYDAVMCRVRYLDAPGALPLAGDIEGYANYWKANYNTAGGAGTVQEFLDNWQRFIGSGST